MVEYLLEAKKFIEYARAAYSAEARDQDLDMAEWCITRAIEEAGHKPRNKRRLSQRVKRVPSRTKDRCKRLGDGATWAARSRRAFAALAPAPNTRPRH